MSIDLTLNRGPLGANVQADADPSGPTADSTAGQRASDLDPNVIAQRKAARGAYLQRFLADKLNDGVDGAATPKTTPKSKLTTNPYALSPETLRKVATDAKAGPALPPPAAHVRPPTTAQMQAFAKRFAMHAPAGAAAGATVGAAVTPEAIHQAIVQSATTVETLTPDEANYVKQLVGRAPPAAVVAAATPAAAGASGSAANPAGVKNSDTLQTIQAQATTFVSWQRFYVLLTKKQQDVLSTWLMQRQKLQILANAISVSMLQAHKQLQVNEIALQQVNMSLAFIRAIESAKNSWTIGMMRPLQNSGLSVMRSAVDLGTGNHQNEDLAPAQDLHRMAFIRRAVQGEAAVAQTPFKHYLANTHELGALDAQGTDSLRVPPVGQTTAGDPGTWQPMARSLLSDEEVARLPGGLKTAYAQSVADMKAQRENDFGSMVGLYSHEADLCRSAAARWQEIANNAPTAAERAAALAHQQVWERRADNIYAKGQPYRERLQEYAGIMCDENRYGDLMRGRIAYEVKRREIAEQLAPGAPALSDDQRAHLQRVKMNIDWRAIALDRELGRYSNPPDDIRLGRWHTGAATMADGFYLAYLQRQGPNQAPAPVPTDMDLRWRTMEALAPKGAAKLNELYIKTVKSLQQHRKLPAFTPQELAGVSRTQMLRHIEDRRKALAKFEDRLTQDPKVRAFHEEEITHLGAVETYVRMEAPFADRVQPQSALPKALQVSALKPSNVAMWRLGRQSQNIKVDPTPHDSVPKGETKPYAQGEQGLRDYYDAKASAGAAIMGEHHIPGSSAYQNPVFEHLNATVGDYSQYVSFDGLESAAFEAADSDTEAVASEAAAKLSEVYGEMAQERRGIQGMIGQFTDEAFKVPT